MTVPFNITNITLGDTFDTWFTRTQTIITDLNEIIIVDAKADTTQGMEETFRNGGVVIMGVNAGAGLGFDGNGALTLGTAFASSGVRTLTTDSIFVIDNAGIVKTINASDMLPSQVDQDMNFTGDISFSGDASFLNATSFLQLDASFRDKTLELAVNFDDELEFATTGTIILTTDVYFVDTNVVGTDFSGLTTTATGTYIGKGTVQAFSDPNVTVTDFVFSTTGDAFQEFTDAGATFAGRYALVDEDGITYGRGLISHDSQNAPPSRQTSPVVASGAGIIVTTNDITQIPSGGSAGEKMFTWLWNSTSADAAWTSSENIQIVGNKALVASDFISTTDYISKLSQTTFIFDRYTYDGATNGFAIFYDKTGDTLSLGGFTSGTTFENSIQINRDSTIIAGTTGLAINLNADLLDGAHGATTGGTSNTIPITGSDGLIDTTFLPGSGRVEEIITQTSHGLLAGACVRQNASEVFLPANAAAVGTADAVGIVTEVIDVNTFRLTYFGVVDVPEIFNFNLGLGYGGATVAVDPGVVYYLSETTDGAVLNTTPSNSSSTTKAMFVALGDQKILITNQNTRPSPTGDTINVESVVPVGSISYVADTNIGSNSDFLTCDGKIYSSTDYPDLKTAIQSQFFIEGMGTGGESSIEIAGAASELRNFVINQTIALGYNLDSAGDPQNTLTNVVINSVTGIASGVRLGLDQPLSGVGTTFYDDVEISGHGDYFVVPDLRARGVVGSGDPDGTSTTEGDFDHGDVVENGQGFTVDSIIPCHWSDINQFPYTQSSIYLQIVPNGVSYLLIRDFISQVTGSNRETYGVTNTHSYIITGDGVKTFGDFLIDYTAVLPNPSSPEHGYQADGNTEQILSGSLAGVNGRFYLKG